MASGEGRSVQCELLSTSLTLNLDGKPHVQFMTHLYTYIMQANYTCRQLRHSAAVSTSDRQHVIIQGGLKLI